MVQPEAVQVLIDREGRPQAVQIDMATWREILAALEDAEDIALARQVLAELDAAGGPKAAGWTALNDVASQWLEDENG